MQQNILTLKKHKTVEYLLKTYTEIWKLSPKTCMSSVDGKNLAQKIFARCAERKDSFT